MNKSEMNPNNTISSNNKIPSIEQYSIDKYMYLYKKYECGPIEPAK